MEYILDPNNHKMGSQRQSKTKCARKFCKNNLTRRAKKSFPKLCKAIRMIAKSLGSKKRFTIKKCIKDMEKNVQHLCERTNCNPSCKDVPNLDAKEIKDGFNKKMSIILKKVLKSAGAESGCYNTKQLERIYVTIKDLQKSAIRKTKKSKSKKNKK